MKFSEFINQDQPVLVDFFAEWCGPCKMMTPVLQELKERLGNKIRIIKVDIDKNPEATSYYQIFSVPTLVLFRKGQIVWKNSGVIPVHELEKTVLQKI